MFTNKLYHLFSYTFQQAIDNHGVQYPMNRMNVTDCDAMFCGCFFE